MKVTVVRFDPAVDSEPYEQSYDVPWQEHITVLEALMYIYENYDPISFDYSCRGRVCGRCGVMLDGTPVLACYTVIDSDRAVLIEPLAGFPVVKDLIVDRSKIRDRVAAIYDRERYQPLKVEEIDQPYDPEIVAKTAAIEWCARCMCCVASCPVMNNPEGPGNFVGPAGLIAIGLRYYDPNDQGNRVVEAVQNGLFSCIECGKCDEVCPAGEIDHLAIYADLRAAAEEQGFVPADKAK